SHPGQALRRPLGRWPGDRDRADPQHLALPRSRPRPGTRRHQALSRTLAGEDLDPQRHRTRRDHPALGRRTPDDHWPRLVPGRAGHDRDSRARGVAVTPIRLDLVLREAVETPYRDLVTRST